MRPPLTQFSDEENMLRDTVAKFARYRTKLKIEPPHSGIVVFRTIVRDSSLGYIVAWLAPCFLVLA